MEKESFLLRNMPAIIALVVMAGFYVGGGYVMYHTLTAETPDPKALSILDIYVVASVSALTGAIGYFIGTTQSSKQKNEMLHNSTPIEESKL